MTSIHVGDKVAHPNFDGTGVVTKVFPGGRELSADFDDDEITCEPVEEFDLVGADEPVEDAPDDADALNDYDQEAEDD